MAPLKFKASPQECKFCNRKSLQFSKVAPLLLVAPSASDITTYVVNNFPITIFTKTGFKNCRAFLKSIIEITEYNNYRHSYIPAVSKK